MQFESPILVDQRDLFVIRCEFEAMGRVIIKPNRANLFVGGDVVQDDFV